MGYNLPFIYYKLCLTNGGNRQSSRFGKFIQRLSKGTYLQAVFTECSVAQKNFTPARKEEPPYTFPAQNTRQACLSHNGEIREKDLREIILRYSVGLSLTWREPAGSHWSQSGETGETGGWCGAACRERFSVCTVKGLSHLDVLASVWQGIKMYVKRWRTLNYWCFF